jgi:hypothetical protein
MIHYKNGQGKEKNRKKTRLPDTVWPQEVSHGTLSVTHLPGSAQDKPPPYLTLVSLPEEERPQFGQAETPSSPPDFQRAIRRV